jgi:hypothetical protein
MVTLCVAHFTLFVNSLAYVLCMMHGLCCLMLLAVISLLVLFFRLLWLNSVSLLAFLLFFCQLLLQFFDPFLKLF